MTTIYIDADACPVKDEVYRVAKRYSLPVVVVANSVMRVPTDPLITISVHQGFGVVDDWIAEQVVAGDIVISSDIPLAARCIAKHAWVLKPNGSPLTEGNIGEAVAMRDLHEELRNYDQPPMRNQAPMGQRDRSRFLRSLDEMINALQKKYPTKK
jgi:uncharacterized protein